MQKKQWFPGQPKEELCQKRPLPWRDISRYGLLLVVVGRGGEGEEGSVTRDRLDIFAFKVSFQPNILWGIIPHFQWVVINSDIFFKRKKNIFTLSIIFFEMLKSKKYFNSLKMRFK